MTERPVTRVHSTAPSTAERLDIVVGMMRSLEWRRGESAPKLAREWGVAVNTVEKVAAEASRLVRRDVENPDDVRADVTVILMANLHRASEQCELGDVAKLGTAIARLLPQRQEVTNMSTEEARAKYKEITGKEWGE